MAAKSRRSSSPAREPSPAEEALAELYQLIASGARSERCREAVHQHIRQWEQDLGEAEVAEMVAELRDALVEGVELADEAEEPPANVRDTREGREELRRIQARQAGVRVAKDAAMGAAQ